MLAIPLDTATEARPAAARLGEAPDALAARAVGSYLEDLEDYAAPLRHWPNSTRRRSGRSAR